MKKENTAKETNDKKDNLKTENLKAKTAEITDEQIKNSAPYKKLENELFLAKEAVKESMETVKNFKADVDRIRERSEKLNAEMNEKVIIEVSKLLIPILDNFEASLPFAKDDTAYKGLKGLYLSLKGALDSLHVAEIVVVGGVLDPNAMEAVMLENTPDEELDGTVAKVLKKGYYYTPSDKIIRVASVSVYKKV